MQKSLIKQAIFYMAENEAENNLAQSIGIKRDQLF
jgi:hypothetical protein